MLDDGYHAVGRYGGVDLDAYSVLGLAPELLDIEVLLHPFEECPNYLLFNIGKLFSGRDSNLETGGVLL